MNSLTIHRKGILFVISAPSGAGKTTLISSLRHKQDFVYSVSCTTRSPRPGEVHGRFYGTLKSTVLKHLTAGVDVLLDVDTLGAASIRACNDPFIQSALADVFIMPPGLDELARRLRKRGTESEEQVATRLHNASGEMQKWRDYRYTLISGSMEEDIEKFRAIMRAERYMSSRLQLDFA